MRIQAQETPLKTPEKNIKDKLKNKAFNTSKVGNKKCESAKSRTTNILICKSQINLYDRSELTNTSIDTPIIASIGNKKVRAEADKNVKWPIHEIRIDYVIKLKKILKQVINQKLFNDMFSTDFKENLEAISILTKNIDDNIDMFIDILDLLFKWIAVKNIDQTNVTVGKSIIDFLSALFTKLSKIGYMLLSFEAAAIFP